MPKNIDVYLVPSLAEEGSFDGKTVVVIDVLRATTTIVHALAAGATKVIPCLHVDQAREKAAELGDTTLLGGEREGVRIEGFQLGNSPLEYLGEKVQGRAIVFTTTNGTKALKCCVNSKRVLIGAFVNFSAICEQVAACEDLVLLCAGTGNEVTREDVLFAGAVASELRKTSPALGINDQAEIAADAWESAQNDLRGAAPLAEILRQSRGGRNLIEIGQDKDIEIASTIDKFDFAPELDLAQWEIVLP